MQRAIALTKGARRRSLRCAQANPEPNSQRAMRLAERAYGGVRCPFAGSLYVSRGSAV